jgi:hypothetical protein
MVFARDRARIRAARCHANPFKDTPSVPKSLSVNQLQVDHFDSSRRLLVYQREYLVFEKTFPDDEGLQEWLTINTLLSSHAIDMLCAKRQIMLGEGIHEEIFAA